MADKKRSSWLPRFAKALLKTQVEQAVAAELAVRETDSTFFPGGISVNYRDRYDYDRTKVLSECLRAWRVQPLARRFVKLYTQFIIGNGIVIKADHKATHVFLNQWWDDPLNNFDEQIPEWMDEITRSGNLFALASVNPADGMTYWRAVAADQIDKIVTRENDIRQEIYYTPIDVDAAGWEAYDPMVDQTAFMLHYAVNRPVGTSWGEPDLAPLLPWIGRYSAFLEDRARLNRYRNTWLVIWKKKWENEAKKISKQNELNTNPPPPGSYLLLDQDETIEMPFPNLASADAEKDGMAFKKMIAGGGGFPLHYLAEPESSTRTTAEAAGTPTFRGLEQAQTSFLRFVARMAVISVKIRKEYQKQVKTDCKVEVLGPDITERDNAQLSLAVARIYPHVADLFDRDGIDEAELLRLVYRMAGEAYDSNANVPGIKKRPLKPVDPAAVPAVEPDTEEEGESDV